jgi:hypothetical protein
LHGRKVMVSVSYLSTKLQPRSISGYICTGPTPEFLFSLARQSAKIL